MAEAEDVILQAAERVGHAARGLWRRGVVEDELGTVRAIEARRRLEIWLFASCGESWPIEAVDLPAAPHWLVRTLGRPAPWQLAPAPSASTDGVRLLLPRPWLEGGPSDVLLTTALGLGWRLAHGRAAPLAGATAATRDVHDCLEGASADAWLARRLPGLAPRIEGVRRRALAARPALERLRPAERALEELVRALLAAPVAECVAEGAGLAGDPPASELLRATARAFSARLDPDAARDYRGIAPVPHWGVTRAVAASRAAPRSSQAPRAGPAPRSGRIARRVERREVDPDEHARSGPFLPPPLADPQLSVQDPAGLRRPRDRGEEEDLDALADSLSALERISVVRAEEPVREVLVSEGARENGAADATKTAGASDPATWVYPEWDVRIRAYRLAACRLREGPAPEGDALWAARVRRERAALLAHLRRGFGALRPRRLRTTRQLDGDDLDAPAWVDEWADRRAGLAPRGRIYAQQRMRRRDVAVSLLVDASGSTDAWVSGRARVIDVAKEAALCFCEALAALGDRHAVYAFSGRGAHGVRVWVAKTFAESGGPKVDARLAGLAPDACTRLGAALRHVTAGLEREPARVRLLLLLSDGKPHDDDEYGGVYGVEDARQAVAEARAAGVHVFCATIDRAEAAYLPRLFGPFGFTVLRDVRELPRRLPELYRRLMTVR